ncbi:hypothetical protein E1H14_12290 [Nitrincola tapanii]|uniref:Glycerophosphoryl diester phosphodiesterase membrane domain-containing protein n=2 Tax=Nitrincola tapanii TaxID=1708751 RepID=A0A5A9W298_9GAMM|nr:hypothetical protein E1H14_12290 [Nitrincola tapanii]
MIFMTQEYLRQAFFFFRSHFKTLAAIQLPFLITLALLSAALQSSIDPDTSNSGALIYIGLLELACLPLYWGATIFYMQSVLDGKPLSPITALSLALSSWGRLLFTYILNALAVALGLLLLIVPGVYAGVRLAFADYICVLEGKRPMEALKSSWKESDLYFWLLLKGFLVIFAGLFLAQMLISQLVSAMPVQMLLTLVVEFVSVLITIYGFRIFCLMRDER